MTEYDVASDRKVNRQAAATYPGEPWAGGGERRTNASVWQAGSMGGVEKRRSNFSLPVAIGGAFATPPQSGLT